MPPPPLVPCPSPGLSNSSLCGEALIVVVSQIMLWTTSWTELGQHQFNIMFNINVKIEFKIKDNKLGLELSQAQFWLGVEFELKPI